MTKTSTVAPTPAHASGPSPPSPPGSAASGSGVGFAGLSRYLKLEKLGEGNYGCVYKARDRVTGRLVALKKIKLDEDDDGVPSTALREVAILQDVAHEHIVRLEQVILERGQLYLVFEYLDLDLRRYLDNIHARPQQQQAAQAQADGASSSSVTPASATAAPVAKTPRGLPLPLVKSYVYQILLGVEHMHAHRHLHRDLKPQNLLINRAGKLQIADLGLARAYSTPMPPVTHEVATLWYRPTEILLGSKPYSSPVDLWAVGCIMAEMVSLHPSFPGDSEIDTLFKIFQCVGTPNEESWPGVSRLPDWHDTFPKWSKPSDDKFLAALHITPEHGLDPDGVSLLRALLNPDPAQRISARRALQHPWFVKEGLHCLSASAKQRLESQAAQVASAAAEQAQRRKAERAARKEEERAKRRRHALAQGTDAPPSSEAEAAEAEEEEEGFDQDMGAEEAQRLQDSCMDQGVDENAQPNY